MSHAFSGQRRLVAAAIFISLLVALAAARENASGRLDLGVAATQVVVDFPSPSIVKRRALDQDIATLNKHAELYGRLLTTRPVLTAVAQRMRLRESDLSGVARLNTDVPQSLMQPESEQRASQIVASRAPYRLEMQSDAADPVLYIYAAAPSPADAERLANAAVAGLQDALVALARRQGFDVANLPQLRQLGEPRGAATNARARIVVAGVTFTVVFGVVTSLLLGLLWRLRREPRRRPEIVSRAQDDWPHTNRLLPWSIAAFIVMLWLTPFDLIELSIPTPIDMKLDRLVLPLLVVVWLLALAAGALARPRPRITPVHVAVGAFVAIAFLSVTLNAQYLNQIAELTLTLKRLPLLLAYVTFFLIVSTSIRPTEVQAFLTLTVALALIVALGIVWEYRFSTNLFRLAVDKLFPSPLMLTGGVQSLGLDSLGRRGIVGPTLVGLEAVAILSLALPIVILRLSASRGRRRLLYAVASGVLIAGMLATERKSGLVAPAAVVLTLLIFRRREMLSLAPLGAIIALAVTVISPGVVRGVIGQFTRSDRGSVATTSDRVADYDAVRPDVWTHLLFGRGYGSYGHETYRMLDSEILARAIETGVLGVLAFVGIAATVVLATRRTVARRGSAFGDQALVGAVAGVTFVVVATLFDVLAFPHATYIFFYLIALASVVIGRDVKIDGRKGRDRVIRMEESSPPPHDESRRPAAALV
jgi:hypothetical protein